MKELEQLNTSSHLDKQNALQNLSLELQHKHQEEIETLRSSHEAELLKLRLAHETEMSKLKSAHDEQVAVLSGSKLREEIREIKAGFEKDKRNVVNQAIAVATAQRAMEVMELKQRLESRSIELAVVKAELEVTKKGLKQFD